MSIALSNIDLTNFECSFGPSYTLSAGFGWITLISSDTNERRNLGPFAQKLTVRSRPTPVIWILPVGIRSGSIPAVQAGRHGYRGFGSRTTIRSSVSAVIQVSGDATWTGLFRFEPLAVDAQRDGQDAAAVMTAIARGQHLFIVAIFPG